MFPSLNSRTTAVADHTVLCLLSQSPSTHKYSKLIMLTCRVLFSGCPHSFGLLLVFLPHLLQGFLSIDGRHLAESSG